MSESIDPGARVRSLVSGQRVLRRYTLARIAGRGAMGVVWLAHDEKLKRDVALKFLPDLVVRDALALADLKEETRRSLDLTHEHIVRVYDFVEDEAEELACIAMEYIDGENLSARRAPRPNRWFEPEELLPWTEQLCAALDYAHGRARIVHRDLKPANLMVNARNELKITDFGIAHALASTISRASAKNWRTSGTPGYMSPQQVQGYQPSPRDDIYALGATLFDLLTGRPPFFIGDLFAQIIDRPAPSIAERRMELRQVESTLPEVWEETVAACLAKEAEERPQSAGEVIARLQGRPVPMRPVPSPTDSPIRVSSKPERPKAEASAASAPSPTSRTSSAPRANVDDPESDRATQADIRSALSEARRSLIPKISWWQAVGWLAVPVAAGLFTCLVISQEVDQPRSLILFIACVVTMSLGIIHASRLAFAAEAATSTSFFRRYLRAVFLTSGQAVLLYFVIIALRGTDGSIPWHCAGLISTAIAATAMGQAVAVFCKNTVQAAVAGLLVLLPMILVSGAIVHPGQMDQKVHTVSMWTPGYAARAMMDFGFIYGRPWEEVREHGHRNSHTNLRHIVPAEEEKVVNDVYVDRRAAGFVLMVHGLWTVACLGIAWFKLFLGRRSQSG